MSRKKIEQKYISERLFYDNSSYICSYNMFAW